MKYVLICGIAVFLVFISWFTAFSGPLDRTWPPPSRFDHPFKGKTKVHYYSPQVVQRICSELSDDDLPNHTVIRGCSLHSETICMVIIANKTVLGQTPSAVLRHEIGHCNGWPANHPR